MANAAQTPNFSSFGTSGQAATPAYGQPSMSVNAMPRQPAEGGIQWGNVVKGVLAVTAVVVAAAVAGWAVYALANTVLGVGTVNTILGTAVHYAGAAFQAIAGVVGPAFHFVSGAVGQVAADIGIGTYGVATAQLAQASGAVAATVAGGAATAGVVHYVNHTDFGTMGQDHATASHLMATKAGIAGAAADPHMAHTLNDMAHHAAGHGHGEHKSFAERYAPASNGSFTSHAEAVRASQGKRNAPTPRSASFSEQLNADRASLENSLGTKIT